ncbi:hypothetical protein K458DRAFT_313076 [Lentithecium fluviatile CBS 122367]|uniref:Fungal N-terminal domain-containing protein n=1 Tax=Lentithecium fluviatile CBS 122367 TaxID=1168545 RepID=A0A6G1INT5_9PLEO|nr:hypothetical protein K458DRAFT_313076 [Lentithecium fluviatile CBS 122367]
MAEVAGAVVGITSLGMQVCQGLIGYYYPFRNFRDDIEAIITRVEGLQEILEALESVNNRLRQPDDAVVKQLQQTVDACSAGLAALDSMRKKCGDTTIPGTWQDKAKFARQRLFWPFKKDTLAEMQTTLDRLQINLLSAQQLVAIDVRNQHFQSLSSTAATLVLHTSNIQSQLHSHGGDLRSVQSGIDDLSSSLEDQNLPLTHFWIPLNRQIEEPLKLQCLDRSPDPLSRIPNFRHNTVPPSLVGGILGTCQDAGRKCQQDLRDLARLSQNQAQSGPPSTSDCTCLRRNRPVESRTYGRFSLTLYSTGSDHLPGCPRYNYSNLRRTVQKKFTFCNRVLRFCARIGYVYAREAGWTTIHPTLNIRAIVNRRDSPAFRAIDSAFESRTRHRRPNTPNTLLQDALSQILQSFKEHLARPTDVLGDGKTLMHVSVRRFL